MLNTSNKWFTPILIIIILLLSGYFIVDYYNHLIQDATCDNQENGISPGGGQGKGITQVYNLLIIFYFLMPYGKLTAYRVACIVIVRYEYQV